MTTRAARGGLLYTSDDDRDVALDIVGIAVSRCRVICLSYALLGTHNHLMFETPEANIADVMQRINWLYARTSNKRHGMRGHVFESRYNAELIQSERHFISTVRYIALNPVVAGLCKKPADWPWSSYAATIGKATPPRWLSVADVLGYFDDRPDVARKQLRYVVEGIWEAPYAA